MKNKILWITLLALIVMFSGCLDGDGDGMAVLGYPGVTVTNFYPVAPEIYSGADIVLYISVQNQGYFDGENIDVILYNCGQINTGTLESTGASYTCNDPISVTSGAGDVMLAPDFDLDISGETREEQITLITSGALFPEGRSQHTFNARIKYDYQSTATRDVVFTTFDNWQETGGALETGLLNYGSNNGPLSLEVKAPSDAIILTDSNPNQTFTVAINIRNIGNGFIENNKTLLSAEFCYPNTFVEPLPGGTCDFDISTEDTGTCLVTTNSTKLRMIGISNQYKDMDCEFQFLQERYDGLVQDTGTFSSAIKYRYASDATTSVTLIG